MSEHSFEFPPRLTSLEVCAGAGGQALGLEQAGFELLAAVELDSDACGTLRANRPHWNVIEGDLRDFSGRPFEGVDLLAGGVPCPPFSIAGKQLGNGDDRDLFPEMLRLAAEARPRAVMIENVRGLLSARFASYRQAILAELRGLGYEGDWRLLNAKDFGVPQSRARSILVALRSDLWKDFRWPAPSERAVSVGECLLPLMGANGWPGARRWAAKANGVGPTLVGGSKKHGGPDLGPTRARQEWRALGVDGRGIVSSPPGPDFPSDALPRLTVEMAALLQGFPVDWQIAGKKTSRYRQVGNAFPPPVAAAVARAIRDPLLGIGAEPLQAQMRLFERLSA
jgi:DNA (cytosine-5)-methyltransferase 1